jgi:putative hydrolase of HD superfamily
MKKFSKKLEQLIDFIQFTHEFREVVRYAGTKLGKRVENDTEHSYQVAMVAWFLIEQDKLKLNKELCFMYALAHDLVEVYAGDTLAHDKKHNLSKKRREINALKIIKKRFSHFKNLIKIIENFNSRDDNESKFIYALDKILPTIQIYLEKGKMWRDKKVSLRDLLEHKSKKIGVSKYLDKYWKEFLVELTKNKKKLFPS